MLKKLTMACAVIALTASVWGADVAVLRNGFTILHEHREQIGSITRLYLSQDSVSYVDLPNEQIERFEHTPSPAPVRAPQPTVSDIVKSSSDRYRLDPDFLTSVIRAESGFNTHAVSSRGAQGLMQLMPKTASQLGVANPFDPATNVDGGTRYLRELLERYHYDVAKALAAYNAGPRRVEQYGGVPPYRETRGYVARIITDYNRKKTAQRPPSTQVKTKLPSNPTAPR